MGSPVCIAVCAGSDCAKDERSAFRALSTSLRDHDVAVVRTKCLGVCHGPVVVIPRDGRKPLVLERLRKARHRQALLATLGAGRLDDGLRSRKVGGKRATKARARSAGMLRRLAPAR